MVSSGPDGTSRRRRLGLLIGVESLLGLVALVYGILTGLWATIGIGVVLLLFAVYSAVVLIGLVRRSRAHGGGPA